VRRIQNPLVGEQERVATKEEKQRRTDILGTRGMFYAQGMQKIEPEQTRGVHGTEAAAPYPKPAICNSTACLQHTDE
jgi:hypothetical protein